jgi:hypothetical protein
MDFLKRLSDRRSIVKQYLKRDVDVHVHLNASGVWWCANYVCGGDVLATSKCGARPDVYKSIVFIEIVEVSELRGPLRSIVRLKPLDHCYMSVVDTLEISISPTIKTLSRAFDRELRSRWLPICIKESEGVDQIIERAAQVIANLSNEDRYPGRDRNNRTFSNFRSHDEVMRRIWVKLGQECISVFCRDGIEPPFKISKVFLCPRYTKASAIKAAAGCGSLHG